MSFTSGTRPTREAMSEPLESLTKFDSPFILREHVTMSLDAERELRELVANVEAELVHPRVLVDSFASWKAVLERRLEIAKSALAPVRRLPVELLIDIFIHAVELMNRDLAVDADPRLPETWGNGLNHYNSFVLGCVCSHWRDVALDCPALWTRVKLSSDDLDEANVLYEKMEASLSRSRREPLYVHIGNEISPNSANGLGFASLVAQSSRWKTAKIRAGLDIVRALAPVARNLPLLQSLDLCTHIPSSEDHTVFLTMFKRAPKLTHITLNGIGPHQILPPRSVKSCAFIGQDVDECMFGLGNWNAVTEAELHLSLSASMARQYTASSLRELRLVTMDRDSVFETLFMGLTLPSLSSLSLSVKPDCARSSYHFWSPETFIEMITRSECTITTLSIGVPVVEYDLLSILESLPALTSFKLEEVTGSEGHATLSDQGLLMRMDSRRCDEGALLVPLLQNLHISLLDHDAGECFPPPEAFVAMIKSRRQAPRTTPCLVSVTIDTEEPWFGLRVKDGLQDLVSASFVVRAQSRGHLQD